MLHATHYQWITPKSKKYVSGQIWHLDKLWRITRNRTRLLFGLGGAVFRGMTRKRDSRQKLDRGWTNSRTTNRRFCVFARKPLLYLVRPTGVEPVTYGLEVRCSIQLSYGRVISVAQEAV